MATTYSPSLPTLRDKARLSLGDTGELLDEAGAAVWFLPNETLDALIEDCGYNEGVARAADALAVRFSQDPDVYEEGKGARIEWKSRIVALRELSKQLRTQQEAPVILGSAYNSGQLKGPDASGLW